MSRKEDTQRSSIGKQRYFKEDLTSSGKCEDASFGPSSGLVIGRLLTLLTSHGHPTREPTANDQRRGPNEANACLKLSEAHFRRAPCQKRSVAVWRSALLFRHASYSQFLAPSAHMLHSSFATASEYPKEITTRGFCISERGVVLPQSCIFSIFLNLHAVFTVITAYLHYRQFTEFHARCPSFTGH
ncbi:hypothetical protein L596_010295 [Steinernema carpocapsae]|uniref:CWH43-like N-terminal domain-containing protein n=1 Tax=Steinernema carpocapsae TaxID=34508 RepID=A0A4U5PIG1_STECR|nr:hypothetical protein L596_010295 [Steinernema carpocapsae]